MTSYIYEISPNFFTGGVARNKRGKEKGGMGRSLPPPPPDLSKEEPNNRPLDLLHLDAKAPAPVSVVQTGGRGSSHRRGNRRGDALEKRTMLREVRGKMEG